MILAYNHLRCAPTTGPMFLPAQTLLSMPRTVRIAPNLRLDSILLHHLSEGDSRYRAPFAEEDDKMIVVRYFDCGRVVMIVYKALILLVTILQINLNP